MDHVAVGLAAAVQLLLEVAAVRIAAAATDCSDAGHTVVGSKRDALRGTRGDSFHTAGSGKINFQSHNITN